MLWKTTARYGIPGEVKNIKSVGGKHGEIMNFIETKARCPHPLFGQFLCYTTLGEGGGDIL